MKKSKKFDCVEMKNKIQAQFYEQLKDMSPAEEIEHRRKKLKSGPMATLFKKLLTQSVAMNKKAAI